MIAMRPDGEAAELPSRAAVGMTALEREYANETRSGYRALAQFHLVQYQGWSPADAARAFDRHRGRVGRVIARVKEGLRRKILIERPECCASDESEQ